jgi:phospholipase/lecithinase/hemolysin
MEYKMIKNQYKKRINTLAMTVCILTLAACGGNTSKNPAGIQSVRVFGDSLADSGVFGLKATVNNAGVNDSPTPIWTELVAKQLSVTGVCNFYKINPLNASISTDTACKSFAVSGARINNLNNTSPAFLGLNNPASIAYQMDTAALSVQGNFPANELILIDGGGNDAADILGAYLAFETGTPVQKAQYAVLLSTLLTPDTVQSMITQPATTTNILSGAQQLGVLYMTALANKMADDINNKLLIKGASKVAVMNVPAITSTPRFKLVLKNIAASSVGTKGAAGAESLARYWIGSFNQTLNNRFKADKRVAIVDFFAGLDRQLTAPAAYGLSNPISSVTGVIDTACPITGTDSAGLPAYNFSTCTASALDQSPQASKWRKMSFSDGFHPSPYTHTLIVQLVNRTLSTRFWM